MQLPAGSSVSLSGLTVATSAGQAPVGASGGFSARQIGSGVALVSVADGAGRPVLCGFLDAGLRGTPTINARSTAVALLFNALQAFTLPRDSWARAIELISSNAATDTLAEVAARRIAANPHAAVDGDTELMTALFAAVDAINPPALPQAARALRSAPPVGAPTRAASVGVTVARRSEPDVAPITVEPSDAQSGVRVLQNTAGNGIVVTNRYRRHIAYYVYRTEWQDSSDAWHSITPWELVAPGNGDLGYVPAVSGFSGVIGSLLDVATGEIPYSEVSGPPVLLSVAPTDAKKTRYRVFVVGPSFKGVELEAAMPADLTSEVVRTELRVAHANACAVTFVFEYGLPILLQFVSAENIRGALSLEKKPALAADIVRLFTQYYPQFGGYVASGNYKSATATLAKAVAENSILRKALIKKLIAAGLFVDAIESIGAAWTSALVAPIEIVDRFLATVDLGIVTGHLATSDLFVQWAATATRPNIRIQPDPAAVTSGLDTPLTCYGVAGVSGTKEYQWSTAGAHGHLEDGSGHSGTSFTSSQQIVRYVADAAAKDGDEDTVSVKAYLKSGTKLQELGSASSSVFIVDVQRDVFLWPQQLECWQNATMGVSVSVEPEYFGTLEYDWTCTNSAGELRNSSGQAAPFTTTGKYDAAYHSGSGTGTDTVSVTVWRKGSGGKRIPIGTKSGTIRVKDPNAQVRILSFIASDWTQITFQPPFQWFAAMGVFAAWTPDPQVAGYIITLKRPGRPDYEFYRATNLLLKGAELGPSAKADDVGIMLMGASTNYEQDVRDTVPNKPGPGNIQSMVNENIGQYNEALGYTVLVRVAE